MRILVDSSTLIDLSKINIIPVIQTVHQSWDPIGLGSHALVRGHQDKRLVALPVSL